MASSLFELIHAPIVNIKVRGVPSTVGGQNQRRGDKGSSQYGWRCPRQNFERQLCSSQILVNIYQVFADNPRPMTDEERLSNGGSGDGVGGVQHSVRSNGAGW